uniref:Uncharacterized protein n=1 Tax=Helianthus annuus TaxID=4232 RepID=A0A251T8M6_HELAN
MVYQPIVSFAIKMKELRVKRTSRMFFLLLKNSACRVLIRKYTPLIWFQGNQ